MSRPKIVWDSGMIQAFKDLRAGGVPIRDCAERIGVAAGTAERKARELGLNGRMNRGTVPGAEVVR